MLNEKECTQILNDGDEKFNIEEVKLIRELLTALVTIEYDYYKQKSN